MAAFLKKMFIMTKRTKFHVLIKHERLHERIALTAHGKIFITQIIHFWFVQKHKKALHDVHEQSSKAESSSSQSHP